MSEDQDRDALRAGDVDREFVAERLREALNEGRLTLTEYDDRLGEAYSARTYGDLKALLGDLPATAPTSRSQVVPASPLLPSMIPAPVQPPTGLTAQWLAHEWKDWFTISAILTAIWLISGGGYFWPVWVIGIIGAIKVVQTVNGLATGEPRKRFDRQQRKAIERAERDERRRIDRDRDRHRDRDDD